MPASAGEAAILLSVAKTELKQATQEALPASQKALQAFKDVKDQDGIAEATSLCISALVLAGDLSEASKMATALVKSSATGSAKLSLAEVLLAQKSDASKAAEEAKAAFDAAGDKTGSVHASLAISRAKLIMGDKSAALEAAQGAVELANSLGDEDSEASAWLGLMEARFAFGSTEDAISAAYAAMGVYADAGDELGEAMVLMKLAETMKEGSPGDALSVASQAMDKFTDLGCKAAAAASLEIAVSCLVIVGQVEEAVAVAKKGAASARGSGTPEAVALMCLMKAQLANKSAEAMEVGKDALALCKSGNMTKEEAKVSHLLCKACCIASEWESAKAYGDAAVKLFKGLGDTASEAATKKMLESVADGLNKADGIILEKEMIARQQRELELELVKKAAQAVEEDDMAEFAKIYAKMTKIKHVTAEECAEILGPAIEASTFPWETVMTKMGAAATFGDSTGQIFEVFHKRISYMVHRLGGMGYGPNLRCVGDAVRRIPNADVCIGRVSLYEGFLGASEDWEGVCGYHPNILDASLQVQSGFGIPSSWQGGLPHGLDGQSLEMTKTY